MPSIFSDNMMFQRNKPVHVWGYADSRENIIVQFNGITYKTKTSKQGTWEVFLPEMKAGGPYTLLVEGKHNSISLENILIGDIWICSGQSNMEFNLKSELSAEATIANSENDMIRLLSIPKSIQTEEKNDIEEDLKWQVSSPSTTGSFSAVGYYFGQKIQKETGIPIGLINSSWGGTDIEPWTSWEASMDNPDYAKYQGLKIEEALGYSMDDIARFHAATKEDIGMQKAYYSEQTNTNDWKTMEVPGAWSGNLANEDGVIWFRLDLFIEEDLSDQEAVLHLGPIDDNDITWVNGVKVGEISFWAANRNYTIKPGILKKGKNTIVVRITDSNSVGGMYGSPEQLYMEAGTIRYPLSGKWLYKATVLSSEYGFSFHGSGPNSFATLLYNGMIHPLTKLPIKGVIWYQGENNAGRAFAYRKLFKLLITDWRSQWGYEFPFLWVQLANFKAESAEPVESDWAELREAQNLALSLPKTGQAVITDIGEAFDIHPRNKKDVGYRLAHNAMNITYGADNLNGGPIFQKMDVAGNRAILSFSNTGEGLACSDNNKHRYIYGFSIAGEDRIFHWAIAYIKGEKVIVFSDEVDKPVAVRYGWEDNPAQINLANSEGMLASPFRTDNWKGITEK